MSNDRSRVGTGTDPRTPVGRDSLPSRTGPSPTSFHHDPLTPPGRDSVGVGIVLNSGPSLVIHRYPTSLPRPHLLPPDFKPHRPLPTLQPHCSPYDPVRRPLTPRPGMGCVPVGRLLTRYYGGQWTRPKVPEEAPERILPCVDPSSVWTLRSRDVPPSADRVRGRVSGLGSVWGIRTRGSRYFASESRVLNTGTFLPSFTHTFQRSGGGGSSVDHSPSKQHYHQ